jgi:hypothetical protein
MRIVTCYLCPFNTKSAALATKFYTIKSSNSILSISLIFHIDKSKSCIQVQQKDTQ